jgi:hypothetical protein
LIEETVMGNKQKARKAGLLLGATAGLVIGSLSAEAQNISIKRTEVRLRKAYPASSVSYDSDPNSPRELVTAEVAQPWWPLNVYMPSTRTPSTLGEPIFRKVKPDGTGIFNGSNLADGTGDDTNPQDLMLQSDGSNGWNGRAVIFGTTHNAGSSGDFDSDGTRDDTDECPADAEKDEPGVCGCGYIDPVGGGSCTDPASAEPSTTGSTESGELRVLELKSGRQVLGKAVKVTKLVGTLRELSRVKLVWALPRFASAGDYLIVSDDDARQNAFGWDDENGNNIPDAGELQTYLSANLAEAGDVVQYKCEIQQKKDDKFKKLRTAKTVEQNGRVVVNRQFAYPQFEVTLTKAKSDTTYRIRCSAENRSTGSDAEFFSKEFNLGFLTKSGKQR